MSGFADGILSILCVATNTPTIMALDQTTQQAMRRVCIARHGGKRINLVFLDGHAAMVDLKELWKLKWHRRWSTPNPLPTIR